MITNSKNKMLSARDEFIVQKGAQFSPTEIETMLEREGFRSPVRSRIYQILQQNGIKPLTQTRVKSRRK